MVPCEVEACPKVRFVSLFRMIQKWGEGGLAGLLEHPVYRTEVQSFQQPGTCLLITSDWTTNQGLKSGIAKFVYQSTFQIEYHGL